MLVGVFVKRLDGRIALVYILPGTAVISKALGPIGDAQEESVNEEVQGLKWVCGGSGVQCGEV